MSVGIPLQGPGRLAGFWPEVGSPQSTYLLFAFVLVSNINAVMVTISAQSMLADVVEASQAETGRRTEGVFAAVKDGEATWAAIMSAVEEDRAGAMKSASEKVASRKTAKEAQKAPQPAAQGAPGPSEPPQAGNPATGSPAPVTEPTTAVQRAVAQAKKTGAQIGGGDPLDIPTE